MCGFAGYLKLDGSLEYGNATVRKMLASLHHRGPDDSGALFVDGAQRKMWEVDCHQDRVASQGANVVLGFNRLSILDLSSNGHQPMIGADGQVALLMNGEIYNAFDFRDNLIQKGYAFKSGTDTEVVLNLYLAFGFDSMIKMLNGMFAIAIVDLRINKLFLARDRFGIKPLYIFQQNSTVAFSSELKAFKAFPGVKFELDNELLDEYLLFRNTINRTLLKNIYNLNPGEYKCFDFKGDCKTTVFYDINAIDDEPWTATKADIYSRLEETLQTSVKRQLLSDVKVGCQLSGGVDSSLVTYFASTQVTKGDLETVSIVFDNPRFSEEKYVDVVANSLHLKAHKIKLNQSYYLDTIDAATWHLESPLNHPNTIGIYLLSEQAKKYVTVLLSGEGADETLAGYSRFSQLDKGYLSRHFLGKLKANIGVLPDFLRYFSDPNHRMVMSSAFGSLTLAYALKPDFNFTAATANRLNVARSVNAGTRVNRQRKYELQTYLPDLLMRQDKMSMAHSIENRVPFLDNDMVEAVFRIPGNLLINKRNGKVEEKLLLKELCAGRFNESFAFRNKMGFGIPLREFLTGSEFQAKLHDELLPGMRARGIFDYSVIQSWVSNMSHISSEQLESLWIMIAFETWAKQYLTS